MPSSSLVEVEVGVEIDVDTILSFKHSLYAVEILFRVAGEMGIKANLNLSCS